MARSSFIFELVLAGTLLCVGLVLLPVSIFWVGQLVVGEYEGEGLGHLLGAIWTELGEGSIAAWVLVLSPYVVFQFARLALALTKKRPVSGVTVSADNR